MKIKLRPRAGILNIAKESSNAHNSEHLIEKAISNLSEAVKIERCEVCKTWIENAKNVVEDKFDKLKYSQGIYNIMKERKIKTPWRELDDKTREKLKKEVKNKR